MTATALTARRMNELAPRSAARLPVAARKATAPQRVSWLVLVLILLIAGLVGGLGTWAVTVPMKSAVLASGQFGVLGNRLVIQHLEGGIVRDILVREGDRVEAGAVLAQLDDTRAQAGLAILHNQLVNALATEARLAAEFTDRDAMTVTDELTALIANDPSLQGVLQTQLDLLAADRRMLSGRLDIAGARIAQLENQRDGVRQRITAQQGQLALFQQELANAQSLLDKGLTTLPRLLQMRRGEAGLIGDLAVSQTNLQSLEKQIIEQQENRLQATRDTLTKIADQRQQTSQQINDIRERIAAAADILDRTVIRAPRSGMVMQLKINTIGEVLGAGGDVAQILPDDTSFVVHVKIKPDDIDQVHSGGAARIRLTAFNFRTTPTVLGTVIQVSPDSIPDEKTGQPFYDAVIELDKDALDHLPKVSVLPGMHAQVMIATGEQTLADYLLGPVFEGIDASLADRL